MIIANALLLFAQIIGGSAVLAGNAVVASSPCLSFSAVDQFVNMLGPSPGTAVTTTNLAAATEGTNTTWNGASAHETFAVSKVALPAAITITGGATHMCGYATQSLAMDDSFNMSRSSLRLPTGKNVVVIQGWIINTPPDQGSSGALWDLAMVETTTHGYAAVVQLQSGSDQSCGFYSLEIESSGNGTFHSSCIAASPGATYFYSLKVDYSANLIASMRIYTTNGTVFTQVGSTVTVALPATDTLYDAVFGNNEFGSSSGVTTYFQNMMVDWTNATFPNLPQ